MQSFVIAAPSSGSGKTTVTLALLSALRRRGVAVAPFKVGPDFIDPGHHAAACGRVSRNLDAWMCGVDGVRRSFAAGCAGAEVAVIEGVMGLFDGARGDADCGSTAEVAKLLGAPVLLVIDAKGQARSVAALLQGFAGFDPELTIAGVIFNRVASARHAELLRVAHASAPGLPPLLGCLGRDPQIALAERHLGLVTAEEGGQDECFYERLAEWFEAGVDLERLLSPGLFRVVPPPLTGGGWGVGEVVSTEFHGNLPPTLTLPRQGGGDLDGRLPKGEEKVRIAVARDEAFCFCYPENLELLEQAGAQIVFFSPLRNRHLPEGICGIYLPGGYPELHAATLGANVSLRAAIRAAAASGMPVYAECGGFVYLTDGVEVPPHPASGHPLPEGEGRQGQISNFVGLFPVTACMLPQRRALGYREVTFRFDTILGPAGTVARGHEFHYSEALIDPQVPRSYALTRADGSLLEDEGYVLGNVLASYVHLHFASNPALAPGLVKSCRRWDGV